MLPSAPLDYIIESTLHPAAKVKEGNHGFFFTMNDRQCPTSIPAGDHRLTVSPSKGAPVMKAQCDEVTFSATP